MSVKLLSRQRDCADGLKMSTIFSFSKYFARAFALGIRLYV